VCLAQFKTGLESGFTGQPSFPTKNRYFYYSIFDQRNLNLALQHRDGVEMDGRIEIGTDIQYR
jgi:hypothetical protein